MHVNTVRDIGVETFDFKVVYGNYFIANFNGFNTNRRTAVIEQHIAHLRVANLPPRVVHEDAMLRRNKESIIDDKILLNKMLIRFTYFRWHEFRSICIGKGKDGIALSDILNILFGSISHLDLCSTEETAATFRATSTNRIPESKVLVGTVGIETSSVYISIQFWQRIGDFVTQLIEGFVHEVQIDVGLCGITFFIGNFDAQLHLFARRVLLFIGYDGYLQLFVHDFVADDSGVIIISFIPHPVLVLGFMIEFTIKPDGVHIHIWYIFFGKSKF